MKSSLITKYNKPGSTVFLWSMHGGGETALHRTVNFQVLNLQLLLIERHMNWNNNYWRWSHEECWASKCHLSSFCQWMLNSLSPFVIQDMGDQSKYLLSTPGTKKTTCQDWLAWLAFNKSCLKNTTGQRQAGRVQKELK